MADKINNLIELSEVGLNLKGQWVLQDIQMQIRPKEIITIIGPNGAGKTCLIKVLLGLLKPSQGRINRRSGVRFGYMPQRLHWPVGLPMTVTRFLKLARSGIKKSAIEASLVAVDAEYLLEQDMGSLSGGELQRVLLARALLAQPDCLILDEPAQGVDITGQQILYQRLTQIRDQQGCAIVMVSHDLHLVMAATDRVFCLNRHICCSGHPEQVSHDPAFLTLFGVSAAQGLAFYRHSHDHCHDLTGAVPKPTVPEPNND